MLKNTNLPIFDTGDLVKFRRIDTSDPDPMSTLIALWDSPSNYGQSECIWVRVNNLAIVIDHVETSYRVITTVGNTGWVDTWDLEHV